MPDFNIEGYISPEGRHSIEQAWYYAMELIDFIDEKLQNPNNSLPELHFKNNEINFDWFRTWFGELDQTRVHKVWTIFHHITFYSDDITIRPEINPQHYSHSDFAGVDPTKIFAYSEEGPDGSKIITLGRKFYLADLNTKVSTLIHELTHCFGQTEDFDFSVSTAKEEAQVLALESPDDAVQCAYNYEYFADEGRRFLYR